MGGMLKPGIVVVGLVSLFGTVGCRTIPLRESVEVPYAAAEGSARSPAVDEAIWRAGRKIGWTVEGVAGADDLTATWRRTHHEAVVAITYGEGRLRIRYVSSRNLLHEGSEIHRNYDRVVDALVEQILREPVTDPIGRTPLPPGT